MPKIMRFGLFVTGALLFFIFLGIDVGSHLMILKDGLPEVLATQHAMANIFGVGLAMAGAFLMIISMFRRG